MSSRSVPRGSAAARSIRLALRASSIVATSRPSLARWVFRCRGNLATKSAMIPSLTCSIPPIPPLHPARSSVGSTAASVTQGQTDGWQGVERFRATAGHVVEVAGDQDQAVDPGRGGEARVVDVLLALGEELTPELRHLPADGKEALAERREGLVHPRLDPTGDVRLPGPQPDDALPHLAHREGTDGEVRVIDAGQPRRDVPVRIGLADLAEDVGVEEVPHASPSRTSSSASSPAPPS